jgi:hypothetical protein
MNKANGKDKGVPLSALVLNVADELHTLQNTASSTETKDKVMKFTECEIEVETTVDETDDGGLKWYVVSSHSESKKHTHKIRLKFSALASGGILLPVGHGAGELPETD